MSEFTMENERPAGKCPCCGEENALISYTIPGYFDTANPGEEYCGYYCWCCEWSAAGSRAKNPGQAGSPNI
jgi:hypothetical protein